MREIILNGMNKEEIMESLEGARKMTEGLEMLLGNIATLEAGMEVPKREVRNAQLKLQESYMIIKEVEASQMARTGANKTKTRAKKR